jgi:membrane protease YdiL (CAAX protease family)
MRRAASSVPVGVDFGALPWQLGAAAGLMLIGLAAMSAGVAAPRVVVLLVLAPVAEEVVFRAGLHEMLLRRLRSPWTANAATALAFALAHALLHGDPAALGVALPALLVGAVYARTRRLGPCVALHAVMNAAWLVWGLGAPWGNVVL